MSQSAGARPLRSEKDESRKTRKRVSSLVFGDYANKVGYPSQRRLEVPAQYHLDVLHLIAICQPPASSWRRRPDSGSCVLGSIFPFPRDLLAFPGLQCV